MKNPELKIFYNAKYSITTPSLIPRQSYWFDKAYNQLTTINQSKDMLIQSENSFFKTSNSNPEIDSTNKRQIG